MSNVGLKEVFRAFRNVPGVVVLLSLAVLTFTSASRVLAESGSDNPNFPGQSQVAEVEKKVGDLEKRVSALEGGNGAGAGFSYTTVNGVVYKKYPNGRLEVCKECNAANAPQCPQGCSAGGCANCPAGGNCGQCGASQGACGASGGCAGGGCSGGGHGGNGHHRERHVIHHREKGHGGGRHRGGCCGG